MRKRIQVLQDIININGNLNDLKNELDNYPYNCSSPMIIITKEILLRILNKVINEQISLLNIVKWSEIVEFREDIVSENETIQEFIFELANSDINGGISIFKIKSMLIELNK